MSLRPRACVHLGNIVGNWRLYDRLSGPGGAGAVVKANAYGHGTAEVSRALAGAGCSHFFVAYAFEGEMVRRAVGPGPEIYVFGGFMPEDAPLCREAGLTPVLNSLENIDTWLATERSFPFALHVDTGMNRLGLRLDEVGDAQRRLGEHKPMLLLSHFACADDPDSDMNTAQSNSFAEACVQFPGVAISLANTAGHGLRAEMRRGLTRPGLGLYGGGSGPTRPEGLKPGMTLEAPILQVRTGRAGETVGYGASARLEHDTLLATVGLGYGDGFLRSAGNSGFGYLGETCCPIVGRISMDLITLDVSAAVPLAKPGAWVEFIGARADLERQAVAAGTLGYELTTGLGSRVERIYED
ncbi:MAG: alanine racemase [Hyphomonadaceae bacterium]|nr:alanine racemase [Hyphomonadaceae bacterium]